MKFLFTAKSGRPQLPLEQRLPMLQASKEWIAERLKDGIYDCSYVFLEGGGMSIGNYDSLEDAFAGLVDYPARSLFDWEVKPLADTVQSHDKLIARMQAALELQKQAGS